MPGSNLDGDFDEAVARLQARNARALRPFEVILGTPGDDTLPGSPCRDEIFGKGGDDLMIGDGIVSVDADACVTVVGAADRPSALRATTPSSATRPSRKPIRRSAAM